MEVLPGETAEPEPEENAPEEAETPFVDEDMEAPEADVAEQHSDAAATSAAPRPAREWEVPEADAYEQAQVVPGDDSEDRR